MTFCKPKVTKGWYVQPLARQRFPCCSFFADETCHCVHERFSDRQIMQVKMVMVMFSFGKQLAYFKGSSLSCLTESFAANKAFEIATSQNDVGYFGESFLSSLSSVLQKQQGWCSGEIARLPPICHEFDSRTARHMWAAFAGCLPCSEGFFSAGYSGFPDSSKTSI